MEPTKLLEALKRRRAELRDMQVRKAAGGYFSGSAPRASWLKEQLSQVETEIRKLEKVS